VINVPNLEGNPVNMAGRALTHGGMAGRRVFRVALVRARGRNRRRMQALRRLMELEMGETQLRVRLGAGGAAVAVAETADVKGVRVKGRLMRVQKQKTEIMYAVDGCVVMGVESWGR
jgi:hypothetical protein